MDAADGDSDDAPEGMSSGGSDGDDFKDVMNEGMTQSLND